MNAMKRFRWLLMAGALALLVVGCQGGGGVGDDTGTGGGTPEEDNTAVEVTMTAYDPQGGGAAGVSALTETVDGILVAVNADGEVFYWQFSLIIDGDSFTIESEIAVPLPEGAYDFYFIMQSPSGRQYAGVAPSRYIFEDDNLVRFLVHPVIGGTIPDSLLYPEDEASFDLTSLNELGALQFQFDFDDLLTFDDPNIGITIDDGTERLFSVNKDTGLSEAFLFLPEGTYTVEVRFYDGGELMNVPIVFTVTVSGDGELQVIKIDLVVNHEPEPETETGTFTVVVPTEVMTAASSDEDVDTVFTLHRDGQVLFEASVDLVLVDDTYEGTVVVPDFETGDITWSVQFLDTASSEPLFGYCAQEVLLATGSQTLICELHLKQIGSATTTKPGTVLIATEAGGDRISNVVILANGEPVGITGTGDVAGEEGLLEVFLPKGEYTIQAVSPDGQDVLTNKLTVLADGTHLVSFNFTLVPPTCEITSPEPGLTNDFAPTVAYETNAAGPVQLLLDDGTTITQLNVANGGMLPVLDDGSYTLSLRVTDAAGQACTDAVDFQVDATAPGVSIQYPANGTYTNSDDPVVVFTSGESGTAQITVQQTGPSLTLDSGPVYVDGIVKDETIEVDVSAATGGPYAQGEYEVLIAVFDNAGNEASRKTVFTVDSVPPLVNITSPPELSEDREPFLNYDITEDGSGVGKVSVYLDNLADGESAQPIATRNGERLPRLDDGEYSVEVDVEDVAENFGSAIRYFSVVGPPAFETFELEPGLTRRPTKRTIDAVYFDEPAVLRIPSQEDIGISVGNPDRFLLFLRMGSVSCVYLGGNSDWFGDEDDADEFEWLGELKSPVCGFGRYHAGDEIAVDGVVSARILTADPGETETVLKITVEIIESSGDPEHVSTTNIWKFWHFHHGRHHHHHYRDHPRWKWDDHHHDDGDDD